MAYATGIRSSFPNEIDKIIEVFNLPASQKTNAERFQYLKTKENLSSIEQTELNNLTIALQDYIIDPERFNLFADIIVNMQAFFKEGVEPFVDNLKNNALNEIDDKKGEIIDYMDSAEAGVIRNDIGVIDESIIEGRTLVDKTNNLKNGFTQHESTYASQTQDGHMTKEDKIKLAGIEPEAYKYTHPSTHSLDMITETSAKKIMTSAERSKLAEIETGATKYTHPSTHSLSIITETTDEKKMTRAERTKLAGIDAGANKYTHPTGTNPHGTTKANVGLSNVDNVKQIPIAGGTFTGIAKAQNNTSYTTPQIRNITISMSTPSGGANGDIWIKYI